MDEEEHQEEEEDLYNNLEEERQHWSEVEVLHGQTDEVKGCVTTSKKRKINSAWQARRQRWKAGSREHDGRFKD